MNEINYPPKFTQADRAHLLRAIGRTFPVPLSVDLMPEHGSAILQFDRDDLDAVNEWAKLTGATLMHGTATYNAEFEDGTKVWHSYGTRHGGKRGHFVGWAVDLWCVVTGAAPTVEQDAAGGAATPGPVADGPPDATGPGRPCCDSVAVTGDTHDAGCPNARVVPPPVQALEAE